MTEVIEAVTGEQIEAARGLLQEYAASVGGDVCFRELAQELARLPEVYGPPTGSLLLARDAGAIVGCVAVRALSSGTCEMKRLYVREGARGRGLGDRLAIAAVAAARRLGYRRMRLETLDTMTAARRLYRSLGFEEAGADPRPGVRVLSLALRPAGGRRPR